LGDDINPTKSNGYSANGKDPSLTEKEVPSDDIENEARNINDQDANIKKKQVRQLIILPALNVFHQHNNHAS
jgi:hypothetical protein